MSLDERVVLIAGATGPLGRAVTAAFVGAGARVALGGTDAERLTAVAAELELPDDRWVAAVGDVTTAEGPRSAAAAATERFGRIDVLVHAVGSASVAWTATGPVSSGRGGAWSRRCSGVASNVERSGPTSIRSS